MTRSSQHLIVISAYNEEHALTSTIEKLTSLPSSFDVVVINDGSPDRTSTIAHQLASSWKGRLHVIDLVLNSGIGEAVQTGYRFAASRGIYTCVVQHDADGQHEAGDIVALVEHCCANEFDLCIGSRFLTTEQVGFRSTRIRRLGIAFLSKLIGFLAGQTASDPTSGFRCAGPRAWKLFAEHYPEPESLYYLLRNGLRVGEIPVRMHARQGGTSSINATRAVYYMAKVTLAICVDLIRPKEKMLA
ncbi:MAG: glycosyltransferase family 2 protein [Planctomycetaceae bacterium]|nr:glycosyltransferase family 2 protein [Planctomycetaceae bacterium]